MIYFLGGAARSGKTAASREFLKQTGIPFFPLDLLMMGFVNGMPEMGVDSEADERIIARQLWPVVRGMAQALDEDRIDYLFEGAQLLPQDVEALCQAVEGRARAVFLGYADLDPQAKLRQIRQYGGGLDDWMRHYDDVRVLEEVQRIINQSRWLRDECARLGLGYIETGLDLAETVDKAVSYLRGGSD